MKSTGSAIIIALCLIVGALIQRDRAEAQVVNPLNTPFAGRFNMVQLCCNGIMFTNTSEFQSIAQGTFMFDFYNMIPNPLLGTGLYSQWTLLPGTKILGSARPVGTCGVIAAECSTVTTQWSVNQMGTSLLP